MWLNLKVLLISKDQKTDYLITKKWFWVRMLNCVVIFLLFIWSALDRLLTWLYDDL